MEKNGKQRARVWIYVVDSRNSDDLRDLDHLDAILWGANPNTRKGDVVLMYRTAPYSDLAHVFSAASDPRPTRRRDGADTDFVIQLAGKIRLSRPITLADIKSLAALSKWSFALNQQGIMRRRRDVVEEGAWPALRRLIIASNRPAAAALRGMGGSGVSTTASVDAAGGIGERARAIMRQKLGRLRVFLSYGSEDVQRVRRLYRQLKKQGWIEPWFDKVNLIAGEDWERAIEQAIQSSDAVVICLSSRSVRKIGFVNTEIGRALRLQDQQPEGTTFILPAKLDTCESASRLAKWQYVELFRKQGFCNLLAGLERRALFLASESSGRSAERPTNRRSGPVRR